MDEAPPLQPKNVEEEDNSYFDLIRKYFKKGALKNRYEPIDRQPFFIKNHHSEGKGCQDDFGQCN